MGKSWVVLCAIAFAGCGEVARSSSPTPDGGDDGDDGGAAVQCMEDTDCVGMTPNPAGCNLERCEDHVCTSTPRHDNASFQVDPIYSAEANVSSAPGGVVRTLWDGTNFLVVYRANNELRAKRVAPDGTVLDPTGFLLDSHFGDIAAFGGGYIVVTTEPADATYPYSYIAIHHINATGAVTVAKDVALYDPGSNCPAGSQSNLIAPQVVSYGGTYLITAANTCGFLVRGEFNTSAPALDFQVPMYRPTHPQLAAGPAGFALATEDIRIGMGETEAHGQTFTTAGAVASNYANWDPWTPPLGDGHCCSKNLGLVAGTTGFLFADTREQNSRIRFRAMNKNGVFLSDWVVFPGVQDIYTPPPMTFDGSNYLVIPNKGGTSIAGYRFDQSGVLLDATPMKLTPDDAAAESSAKLASDGAGRNVIAYTKSSDGKVYVRAFSTCP